MRITVDASELPGPEKEEEAKATEAEEGGPEAEVTQRSLVEELASFLGERLGCEVMVEGGEISLELGEGQGLRRKVRQLLKKFLYKQGLTDEFRVISTGGGGFRIKRRRFPRLKERGRWA